MTTVSDSETVTLSARVVRLLDEAARLLPASTHPELDRLRSRLEQPLNVVLAGRVSAGKSTLVNALLGRRIAPTGATETTRVVARFRYGHSERAELVMRSGERRPLALEEGRVLPRELGVDPRDVRTLEVTLKVANGILDRMVLIDTPGLGGLNQAIADPTRELMGVPRETAAPERADTDSLERADADSRVEMDDAEALLFLVNPDLHDQELAVVRAYQQANPKARSAANTIGILSRADLIRAPDPWAEALVIAEEHRRRYDGAVGEVLPLMGRIAEAAETAALSDDDVNAVVELSTLEPAVLRLALLDVDRFERSELPLDRDRRRRLVEILDLRGIARAVQLVRDDDAPTTARMLRTRLRALSGFEQLRATLIDDIARRGDAIKARTAITRLTELVQVPAPGAAADDVNQLHGLLEQMLKEPALQQLSVIEAWATVYANDAKLPPQLEGDLRRFARGGTLSERLGLGDPELSLPATRAALEDTYERWAFFTSDTGTALRRHTRESVGLAMQVACTLALDELDTLDPTPTSR